MSFKFLVLSLCISLTLGAYVQTVAKELITYAAVAYQDPETIQNWSIPELAPYKLNHLKLFSYQPKNFFGFAGYSQSLKAIAIIFRGTEPTSLINWISDITLYQSDYPKVPGGKVHTGFYEGISLLSSGFIAALQKLTTAYPNAQIYVAGHSLGAALASLAAPIIRETFPNNPIAQIITGGKPRVGNQQYVDWYNSIFESYRVVYKRDQVPHIPTSGPLSIFGSHLKATHMSLRHHMSVKQNHEQLLTAVYVHQGKEVWYSPNWSQYKICTGESSECSSSILLIFTNWIDHIPSKYLQMTTTATQV